jgi:hypothetical protein
MTSSQKSANRYRLVTEPRRRSAPARALCDQTGCEHHWLINPDTGEVAFWTSDTGKGAFRRFKDELHQEYPDLLPAWYVFRDTRARRRAVQCLTIALSAASSSRRLRQSTIRSLGTEIIV